MNACLVSELDWGDCVLCSATWFPVLVALKPSCEVWRWHGSHWCRYLISHGANVAAVNSEGEVPSDIAEEAAMKDLLLEQVKKQGKSAVGLHAWGADREGFLWRNSVGCFSVDKEMWSSREISAQNTGTNAEDLCCAFPVLFSRILERETLRSWKLVL